MRIYKWNGLFAKVVVFGGNYAKEPVAQIRGEFINGMVCLRKLLCVKKLRCATVCF